MPLANLETLQNTTMTIAQKLKNEGRVEGRVEGEWIGMIRVLEGIMGRDPSSSEALAGLSIIELRRCFEALQSEYEQQYKQR